MHHIEVVGQILCQYNKLAFDAFHLQGIVVIVGVVHQGCVKQIDIVTLCLVRMNEHREPVVA